MASFFYIVETAAAAGGAQGKQSLSLLSLPPTLITTDVCLRMHSACGDDDGIIPCEAEDVLNWFSLRNVVRYANFILFTLCLKPEPSLL